MNKNCIFCKIVNKESPAHIVWEDERHIAFLSIFPNTEGTTVVIPKEHHTSYLFDLCNSAEVVNKKSDIFLDSGIKIKSIYQHLAALSQIFKDKGVKYQKERADYFSQGYRSLEENIKSCLDIKEGYMCNDKGADYGKYFWNLNSVILVLSPTIQTTYKEKISQCFKRLTDDINTAVAKKKGDGFKLSSCVWIDDIREYLADYEKIDDKFKKMIVKLKNNDSYFSSDISTDPNLLAKTTFIDDLIRELQNFVIIDSRIMLLK